MAKKKNPEESSSSSAADNHDEAATMKDEEVARIKAPNENTMYLPSLVHLKCRGALHLASPDHNAICKGVSSRLETIREYPPMKPLAALHTFQNQTSFYHPPDGDNDDSSYQASFGSKARVFDGQPSRAVPASRKEKKMDLPVVVDAKWTEMKETLQAQTSVDLTKLDATQSEMTIYGTSSAYFLVLKPYSEMYSTRASERNRTIEQTETDSKENTNKRGSDGTTAVGDNASIGAESYIYAVNPVNEFGVAKRKVSSKENGVACISTTVKLGFLEIQMASLEEVREVDPDMTQSVSTDSSSPSRKSMHSKSERGPGMKPSMGQQEEQEDVSKPKLTALSLPSIPSQEQTLKFLEKIGMASDKIQNQMYENAKFIKEELENDFVSRTFKASQKVAGNCKKNLGRMQKTGEDIINFLSGKD
jgi:hypothetical protein